MIRFLKFHIAVLLGVITLCSGCSAPKPPPPTPPENDVPWVYEPDAVVLRISADERLNEHEGEPSSLMLCVYELATREGVDKGSPARRDSPSCWPAGVSTIPW